MKFFTLSLMVAGTIALTGCSTLVSLNPFVTDEQAVLDPALPGVWISQDGKETYMIRQEGTGYSIRFLSDSSESYQFKAKLMAAGDVKLLDLVSANDDAFQLTVHTPVRVWVDSNTAAHEPFAIRLAQGTGRGPTADGAGRGSDCDHGAG